MKKACCLFINIKTRERKAYKFVQYYKSLKKKYCWNLWDFHIPETYNSSSQDSIRLCLKTIDKKDNVIYILKFLEN